MKQSQPFCDSDADCIVLHDCTERIWCDSQRYVTIFQFSNLPILNDKVDLREEPGQVGKGIKVCSMVQTYRGRAIAEQFGADYFECSAKTGRMVEDAFVKVATKVRLPYTPPDGCYDIPGVGVALFGPKKNGVMGHLKLPNIVVFAMHLP